MASRLSNAQDALLARLAKLTESERVRLVETAERLGSENLDLFDEFFDAVDEENGPPEDTRNFQRVR